jgi:hypothetical protein
MRLETSVNELKHACIRVFEASIELKPGRLNINAYIKCRR